MCIERYCELKSSCKALTSAVDTPSNRSSFVTELGHTWQVTFDFPTEDPEVFESLKNAFNRVWHKGTHTQLSTSMQIVAHKCLREVALKEGERLANLAGVPSAEVSFYSWEAPQLGRFTYSLHLSSVQSSLQRKADQWIESKLAA